MIPVKNGEKYLFFCLKSLSEQSYKNFEVILVDNNSTDNSIKIANSFKKLKLKITMCRKKGVGAALAHGLKKCNGKFICRIDCDDIAHPNRIKEQINKIRENSNIAVVSSNALLINEKNKVIGNKQFFNSNLINKFLLNFINPISHPTCMFRKDVIQELGSYNESNAIIEDYDLWLRLKKTKYKFVNIKKFLIQYRSHKKSETNKNKNQFFERILATRKKAFKQKNINHFAYHLGNLFLRIKFFIF